ncbi:hypothetical protein ACN28I_33280 [Archangium gephyra]|uniref:hypothetical protein n=1 Tax=Archangium gephyra TaxID=48 RepID=UPI003B7B86D3
MLPAGACGSSGARAATGAFASVFTSVVGAGRGAARLTALGRSALATGAGVGSGAESGIGWAMGSDAGNAEVVAREAVAHPVPPRARLTASRQKRAGRGCTERSGPVMQ